MLERRQPISTPMYSKQNAAKYQRRLTASVSLDELAETADSPNTKSD
ncbi:hypothetical protein Rvan_3608 [Rhodomicrobium vannielii ATCC 17100]|uniref:Uncharacterized protein n=1 Tax=Rhodomicrobium vannielii (strain ATCC 17100 / DSM 162 / LMG 4299 / NCIMB 10020 / ATH 3.1.1) TaxID=648757 RepID=E3I4V7_RHOVT|nr:hypothetical protein Rvan_3608 [Rhodomicrobium vannielii ATCC 17100]